MASAPNPDQQRFLRPLLWVAVLITLMAIFPPFHVRRLGVNPATPVANPAAAPATLDVTQYSRAFWVNRLLSAANRSTDAVTLVAALASDPDAASQKYGRRTGLGGKTFFLINGEGRIRSIERGGVLIGLGDHSTTPVLLSLGPLFGNCLRDATGLLDMANFSSFDFNALSAELNRLAETEVQPRLKHASVGAQVHFAGCAEFDVHGGKTLLKVVSIDVEYPT